MTRFEETTKCKVCGEQHRVENYEGMRYYFCQETCRVYLLAGGGVPCGVSC